MELQERIALTAEELAADIWYAYDWPHHRSTADIEHFLLYARAASTMEVGYRDMHSPPGWGALGATMRRHYYATGPECSRVSYEVRAGAQAVAAERWVGEVMAKRAGKRERR